jgi:hypothetical protein
VPHHGRSRQAAEALDCCIRMISSAARRTAFEQEEAIRRVEPAHDGRAPERQFDFRKPGGNVIHFQLRIKIGNLWKGISTTNNEV